MNTVRFAFSGSAVRPKGWSNASLQGDAGGAALKRPYLSIGATPYLSGTNPRVSARFQAALAGVAPFAVTGAINYNYIDIGADVELTARRQEPEDRLWQFGNHTHTHAMC